MFLIFGLFHSIRAGQFLKGLGTAKVSRRLAAKMLYSMAEFFQLIWKGNVGEFKSGSLNGPLRDKLLPPQSPQTGQTHPIKITWLKWDCLLLNDWHDLSVLGHKCESGAQRLLTICLK